MSTLELPWLHLFLGSTCYYADESDPQSCSLQWHTAAATLYILVKDKVEIDLRLEREITNIKVMFYPVYTPYHTNLNHTTVPEPKGSRWNSHCFNENVGLWSTRMGQRNGL